MEDVLGFVVFHSGFEVSERVKGDLVDPRVVQLCSHFLRRLIRLRCVSHYGCLRMPTESVFLRKENREKLRKAEEKTSFSLARLINLLVEEGYLDELVTKHRKGNLRSAY